jgi:hypothetical protein
MFCSEGILAGFVDNDVMMSFGRLLRNAPKQLMVRGTCFNQLLCQNGSIVQHTPLNPMHFNPTSLISSVVFTDCFLSFEDSVARLYSSVNDSGEFMVIVAAV